MTDIQTEKAFQRQLGVFQNSKKVLSKKVASASRLYRKIGLGKFSSFN
jgi:small subunit ribosomal protein S11e